VIASVPGLNGTHAQINLLSSQVTVRLTRDQMIMERSHVELARAISAVAKAHGAVADRSAVSEVQVAISAKPDAIDLGFWRAVLGYAPMQSDNAIDPLGNSSTVWMQELDAEKPLRHAMHIDVSVPREQAEVRLAAAVAAGGVIVDASHAPSYWILADRSGNKVCIAAWPDGAVNPNDGA
jgi:4a-hydroxytetrahydrobiopterin dehydratase